MTDDPTPAIDSPLAPTPRRLALRFVGSGSEYFRIWIVNLLLTIVTLGLYYPFAKVRRLRYFHASTEVGGHPLSFHADPWKMLRGYLLVTLLLVLYGAAGHVSPMVGLFAFVVVAGLWPALWHSSLRFRLANTGWLGLRGRFTGTLAGAYRALAPATVPALMLSAFGAIFAVTDGESPGPSPEAGWLGLGLLLAALTLASIVPWTVRRYQHGHYGYAGERSSVDVGLGRHLALMSRGGLMSVAAWVLLLALLFAVAGVATKTMRGLDRLGSVMLGAGLVIGVVVYQALLKPWFIARLQNLWWNQTRSVHFAFESRLRFRSLLALSLVNWLLIVATLGLYFPFAAVRTARLRLESVTLLSGVDPGSLAAAGGLHDEAAAGDAAGDLLGLDIGL